MPRCNICAIKKECKEAKGFIVIINKGTGKVVKTCPLLLAVRHMVEVITSGIEK